VNPEYVRHRFFADHKGFSGVFVEGPAVSKEPRAFAEGVVRDGGTSLDPGIANPVPFVNQPLIPATIAPGGPEFALTVNGTGFVSGSVVSWNGRARNTTFISSSQLTATIMASDIATPSTAAVSVFSPSPGGGRSNVVFFEVTVPTPSVSFGRSDYATETSPETVRVGISTVTARLTWRWRITSATP
jgi:hypothetical protein